MGGFVGLFGQTAGQRDAQKALLDAEDRIMQVTEEEKRDHACHVDRDEGRHGLIIAYLRDTREQVRVGNSRTLFVLVSVAAVLFFRGAITWQQVGAFFTGLGGH